MRNLFTSLALLLAFSLTAQQAILTGIMDGDLVANGQGGNPKAIELYVNGSLDLSGYQLSRVNGNNSFTFPAGSSYTDEFVYLVNGNGEGLFVEAFGEAGDFANRIVTDAVVGNGNDPYQLLDASGTVLDQTGGSEGTGNNYRDGHRYRVNNTGPDGGWVEANWSPADGNSTLDGRPITEYAAITGFGTFMIGAAGPSATISASSDLFEQGTAGGFTVTLSETAAADVTITYELSGTAILGTDYNDEGNLSVTIPADSLSATVTFTPIDDSASEPTETIVVMLTESSDPTFSATGSTTINLFDDEPIAQVLISTIQGSGNASPVEGQTLSIQGIVVADFQGGPGEGLNGFFVQEEDTDADADPLTSEGVWVFDGDGTVDVMVGDRVNVTGRVEENRNLTQINVTADGGAVSRVGENLPLPTPASLNLETSEDADYEAIEGMLTNVTDLVTITQTFGIARFGEFEVAAGGRLVQFTECNEPDAEELAAYNAAQSRRRLSVDDGRAGNNNFPIVLGNGQTVDADNTIRSGSTISNLTGIMDERANNYRLQGTDFSIDVPNPRPTAKPDTRGNITVVSMNVLNYFTTLGRRGADNAEELERQEAKIVAAICELDADVVGLIEIENNGYGADGALQTLIDAVAASCGTQYEFVTAPNTGTDEIQVALIYKSASVEQSGNAASLTQPNDVFSSNRVPLAQTFRVIGANNPDRNQQFTVCVNHWKSKGGSCGAGDDDTGGAGSCDGTRTAAAVAIRDWLATNPTGTTDPDYLIVGDLNAYSAEAPLRTLTDAGYVNTVLEIGDGLPMECGSALSYVFRGEWGNIDHALANPSLARQVTVALAWDVNASEPTALDYDTRFNNLALYNPDFYRFSDHNPVVVGLDLTFPVSTENPTSGKRIKLRRTSSDGFQLRNTTAGRQWQLVTAGGQQVRAGITQAERTEVSGSSLPAGIYFLAVDHQTFRVVIR